MAPGAKSHAFVTPDPKYGGNGRAEPILFTTVINGGRGCGQTGVVTIQPAKDWPARDDAERMTNQEAAPQGPGPIQRKSGKTFFTEKLMECWLANAVEPLRLLAEKLLHILLSEP